MCNQKVVVYSAILRLSKGFLLPARRVMERSLKNERGSGEDKTPNASTFFCPMSRLSLIDWYCNEVPLLNVMFTWGRWCWIKSLPLPPPHAIYFNVLKIIRLLDCAVHCLKISRKCKIRSTAHLGRLRKVSYLKHMFQMLVRDG